MLKCPPTHCCSVSQAWVRQKLKLDAEAERQYNKRKEPEVKGLAESLKDSSAYLEKTADNLKKFADERGQYHAGADVLLAEGSEEADKSGTEEPEGGRTHLTAKAGQGSWKKLRTATHTLRMYVDGELAVEGESVPPPPALVERRNRAQVC